MNGEQTTTHTTASARVSGQRSWTHGDPQAGRRYKKWILLALAAALAIAATNGLFAWFEDPPPPIQGLRTFSGLPNDVVDGPIAYTQRPPAGGPHAALTQQCGLYRVPVRDENVVASLATGAVWVAYNPGLPAKAVADLRGFAQGELDVIFAPYPGLPADVGVVLTAWGRQLTLTPAEIPDPRIPRFIQDFQNGAQSPNPAGDCRRGVSIP